VNLGDSDDEKEELKLNLNVNDENIEASDEESMIIIYYCYFLFATTF